MRAKFLLLLPVLCLAAPAAAQVTINRAALDQLAGVPPPAPAVAPAVVPAVAPAPSAPPVAIRRRRRHRPMVAPEVMMPPPPVPPPPGSKPEPMPVVAPVTPRPAAPKPAAPLPVIAFAAGSADLSAAATAALHGVCEAAGSRSIAVSAAAPADPADASAAMRLSMQRAFAVRDALVACGVPDARIIPRAIGDAPGQDANTARLQVGP